MEPWSPSEAPPRAPIRTASDYLGGAQHQRDGGHERDSLGRQVFVDRGAEQRLEAAVALNDQWHAKRAKSVAGVGAGSMSTMPTTPTMPTMPTASPTIASQFHSSSTLLPPRAPLTPSAPFTRSSPTPPTATAGHAPATPAPAVPSAPSATSAPAALAAALAPSVAPAASASPVTSAGLLSSAESARLDQLLTAALDDSAASEDTTEYTHAQSSNFYL